MDRLTRFVFEHAPLRGEIVQLDETWQHVLSLHAYPPLLQRALGELMAAAALLYATLKFNGSLVMQLQGEGPVQLMVVECAREFGLRATARWSDALPEQGGLRELAGNGRFAISLVPEDGGQTYQGIVPLEGDTIQAILEGYMTRSEQLDTRLWLAADGQRAVGMLLQKLPDSESTDADAWNRATILADSLTRDELMTLDASRILRRLYHEETLRVFDPHPVSFRCSCSRARTSEMLRMLGLDQARSLIAERGNIEITCEFCNTRYAFDAVDAEQLFASSVAAPANETRH